MIHRTAGLAFLIGLTLAAVSATPARADDPKACCKVIRVSADKHHIWVRNPRGGQVAQLNLKYDDDTVFAVGDRFNPDDVTLNGKKLQHVYPVVLPELDPPNAHIIRARGAEVAVSMDESKTVYRFYALKFGIVLSTIKPGDAIYIDEAARWAFVRLEERGKAKPSVWAFELD